MMRETATTVVFNLRQPGSQVQPVVGKRDMTVLHQDGTVIRYYIDVSSLMLYRAAGGVPTFRKGGPGSEVTLLETDSLCLPAGDFEVKSSMYGAWTPMKSDDARFEGYHCLSASAAPNI
jgi:hypothetical protein